MWHIMSYTILWHCQSHGLFQYTHETPKVINDTYNLSMLHKLYGHENKFDNKTIG